MNDSINIAVAGASGYVGQELVFILSKHPKVKIKYLCGKKSIGKSFKHFNLKLKKKLPKISSIDKVDWKKINVLFTSLPNGEAQKIANKIPSNTKIIDLSADFRINDFKEYKKWYKINHITKHLLKKSIYAITEFSRYKLKKHRIIACPGCYPTSVQIPLIPLIQNKMINNYNIVVDSKSGYSGAGKNLKKKFPIKNIFKSVSAYGVGSHRHMAEIDQELSKAAKKKIKVFFTPHLIPMFRGILSTIYLEVNKKNNALKTYKFLKKFHKRNPFIKIAKFNKTISTAEVMNTNYCKISVCKDRTKNKIIIISALDNLIKGAAGQAVQNMNVMFNLKETTGLI